MQDWLVNITLNPNEWGYELKGGHLRALRMVNPAAPEYLLKVIRCNCKTTCSTLSCTCMKHGIKQAWGQSTQYFGTLVLEYRFFSTRRYSVLVLLKSTCTRTCTQVLLKLKVLLTSTNEYFMSTSHLKLIQNSSHTSHKSL